MSLHITTLATGEEGPGPTTLATGEESLEPQVPIASSLEPLNQDPTTLATGEEGGGPTTLATGEEHGYLEAASLANPFGSF
ncbi:MAG: hypothetical protein JWM27_2797 [Gemmatimonadetes bacterium]|nr:hypothetical protein [Gemmatimonadota bacterium]